MVTTIIPIIAKNTPILFFKLKCSLNKNKPTSVDRITIPTLFSVNNTELSKFLFCKALIKNTIE